MIKSNMINNPIQTMMMDVAQKLGINTADLNEKDLFIMQSLYTSAVGEALGNFYNNRIHFATTRSQEETLKVWYGLDHGIRTGIYGQNQPRHPMQNQEFPFLYDPSTDEYIGFRWDYSDVNPLQPALTSEKLQTLNGLFISPGPSDYFCSHGGKWDCRFTVVYFKKPTTYFSFEDAIRTKASFISDNLWPNEDYKAVYTDYVDYKLSKGAEPLQNVGYEAILFPMSSQVESELFIFNPKLQVTRTIWTEWRY